MSYAQLYTLTLDEGSRNFDVQAIPIDLVVRILVPILNSIDKPQLDDAINVRADAKSPLDIVGSFADYHSHRPSGPGTCY